MKLKKEIDIKLREVEAFLNQECIQDQRKSSEIFWAQKIENFCGNRRLS